ncbi:sigma-70 family RNA polymerase sigma factor [Actinocorallia longicatena]|uniref:RNA polymerase sigma factor n=2 Tax=Actinocorallia longicatena TaxID=111803 RepID=A0ABP6Q0S5_9ACTN
MTMVEQSDFTRLTGGYRGELLAYCYRMTGSAHDAEDLVQEVYLRAWRSYGSFEGRSSLRTWLYRIATNACLNALGHSSRRVLPSGLSGPLGDPDRLPPRAHDLPWLEPFPDAALTDADPAVIVAARSDLRLALVAALQNLPVRQRAILILRDVLSWSAAEVATFLDTTPVAVNSGLQRARVRLERLSAAPGDLAEPSDPRGRDLLDRFVSAFEAADLTALAALLTEDVTWEMPPNPAWFAGRDAVLRLVASRWPGVPGGARLLPTTANSQPAAGMYVLDGGGAYRPHSLKVLTVTPAGIRCVHAFHSPELFPAFGLPDVLRP